jgi:hypothetical protein
MIPGFRENRRVYVRASSGSGTAGFAAGFPDVEPGSAQVGVMAIWYG